MRQEIGRALGRSTSPKQGSPIAVNMQRKFGHASTGPSQGSPIVVNMQQKHWVRTLHPKHMGAHLGAPPRLSRRYPPAPCASECHRSLCESRRRYLESCGCRIVLLAVLSSTSSRLADQGPSRSRLARCETSRNQSHHLDC